MMETNPQTSQNIEIEKKRITIRTVLNIYGIFTSFALIVSIFTNPISMNENMEFIYLEELMMEKKKIKEFILFICCTAVVYFPLVNLYYKFKKKDNAPF